MRISLPCTLSLAIALAVPALAQPDRRELLSNPQYAAKDRKPVFKTLTAEEVRSAIKVTTARNSALFGFNDSALQVHLPRIDNSNWIEDKFAQPKLLDKRGREVKYEKEQGIYDHSRWSTEIRFAGDGKNPVDFAKAVGSVHIRYPRVMTTKSVKKGETKKAEEAGVGLDGPFVKFDLARVPESAFASDLDGVRAYDKNGKRLEKVLGYTSSSWENGVSYRGYAYHGEVARLDFDVAEEWVDLEISFEMPPAPKLGAELAGSSSGAAEVTPTPGGKYEVKIVPAAPPAE
jgi:hypothetical protein